MNKYRRRIFVMMLCLAVALLTAFAAVSCSSDKDDVPAEDTIETSVVETEEPAPEEQAEEPADTSEEDAAALAEKEKAEKEKAEKEKAEAEKKKAEKEKAEKEKAKKEKSESKNSSSGGSTDPNAGKKWVDPVYKEVYHEEKGHYETQNTGRIKCCGSRSGKDGCDVYFSSMDAYKAHQQAYVEKKRKELNDPDYECQGDHAPAKYETKEVWVVDEAAWTEKVLVSEGHWE